MQNDPFGILREQKIRNSKVRDVFTPHVPIMDVHLFFGRQRQVASVIEHLNTPGQHALLFGDRGVGKSSLANICADVLLGQLIDGPLIKKSCDSTDTFLSIVAKPLLDVGVNIQIDSESKSKTEGGNAGLNIPVISAGIKSDSTNASTASGLRARALSPAWVAEQIGGLKGLLLIDEVDAISDAEDKQKLAELVKQLSDAQSPLKILLVGIAQTAADLTAGHPSVQRCLRETRVGRMGEQELKEIIFNGQKKLNLSFSAAAVKRIVAVSSGYPHFTHLLALKSAEDAIAEGKKEIFVADVEEATRRAVNDAEGSLKKTYDDAVRSAQTETYKKILLAASLCKSEELTAAELRGAYEKLHGEAMPQSRLNNYLIKLVSGNGSRVLRRLGKGVYRFSDPRMPSYVRIAQSHIRDEGDEDDD